MFEAHSMLAEYRTGNLWTLTAGVLLIFAGLPMVILSCLFFFDPEALAVSVTMADTSVGIALNNYALAWAGGALTGALIAYRTRKYAYLLLGPFAGYVANAPALDVYEPWQAFLVALAAPFAAYATYEYLGRKLVDEHKLLPVFAAAGSFGLIMVGLIDWGTAKGGYVGIEEGAYAFQHSEINVLWQLIGIAVCLGLGVLTAAVLSFIFERTIGMRVTDDDQAAGLDAVLWELQPEDGPVAVPAEGEEVPRVAAPT
jgi:ammonia channel protein AmtB